MGTKYLDKGKKPDVGNYLGFDHIKLYVSNAKQVADWYIGRFGFQRIAFSGLETGCRKYASHVLRQNNVTMVLVSSLDPTDTAFGEQLTKHGDGVKDVAFAVDDCAGIIAAAVSRGAKVVHEVHEEKDEFGSVIMGSISTYGDTIHTFVQRSNYKGLFLPGFRAVHEENDVFFKLTENVGLLRIDHVVGNQSWNEMNTVADFYVNVLQFHRFWSVDDKTMHTEYSALSSVVVADYDEVVKMPINEPAKARKKSQIEEFVDFYGGAGVQHVALATDNIIESVSKLRERGVAFLTIPDKYYDNLRLRLKSSPVQVLEDLSILQKLQILVDFDEHGYLLQLFTHPVEDRPTLFYEIIQRRNNSGFGAGNFKALFESIEIAQEARGNL